MILDLDEVLEADTQVKLLDKVFVIKPISLQRLMEVTYAMDAMNEGRLEGDVATQYHTIFSKVVDGLSHEDVVAMTTSQVRTLYVFILEKIMGKRIVSKNEAAEKKKT